MLGRSEAGGVIRWFFSFALCRCSNCGAFSRVYKRVDLDTGEVDYAVAWRGVCWRCYWRFTNDLVFDCGVTVTR